MSEPSARRPAPYRGLCSHTSNRDLTKNLASRSGVPDLYLIVDHPPSVYAARVTVPACILLSYPPRRALDRPRFLRYIARVRRDTQLRSALRTAIALACLGLLSPAAVAQPYSAPVAASVAGIGVARAVNSIGRRAASQRSSQSRDRPAPPIDATPLLLSRTVVARKPTQLTDDFVLIEDAYLRNAVLLR